MKPLRKIGIITFIKKAAVNEAILRLADDPAFADCCFFYDRGINRFSHPRLNGLASNRFPGALDALVSFGGDGSFLSASRLVLAAKVPLVGVNMGGLGFLTDVPVNHANIELRRIFDGRYFKESRRMFDVSLLRSGRTCLAEVCLNDAVVKGERLLNFSVSHGQKLVSVYNADGLIVATPTGSTAYCMAAGGPIADPALECAIIAPICSHSLTQKPIVLSMKRPVAITLTRGRAKAALMVDGKRVVPFHEGDTVVIARSRSVTTLLKPLNFDYFGMLRKKLNWGRD
ncbi:MAG: NAD(+)/NADH kinase [Fibrobacterota bacterium]